MGAACTAERFETWEASRARARTPAPAPASERDSRPRLTARELAELAADALDKV
ncbi:MAG: hypothetical protein KF718_16905 [Polyangiaceae bacterium]|nr:hypothetical protein [Polyangiaceae bacterium]